MKREWGVISGHDGVHRVPKLVSEGGDVFALAVVACQHPRGDPGKDAVAERATVLPGADL